jgi:hypothetical protein
MLRFFPASLFVLCLAASAAVADHGKGAIGGRTISPRTLHEEEASVETGFRYQRSETFSDDKLLTESANGHDIHSVDWLAEFSIAGSYGVNDQLTVSLSMPFEVIHGFRFVEDDGVNPPFVNGANSIVGMGDMSFFGKYSLVSGDIEVASLLGVKIPTGSTSQKDNTGNLLEPDHQPGTGSWDPLIGAAVARQFELLTFGASVLYRLTTEGRHDFKPGSQVIVAMKGEYQIAGLGKFPRVYASLELAEQFTAKDEGAGVKNQDTGGSILTLGPGLRVRANDKVSFGATVSFPIYQGLNGIQHKEKFEFLFGTGVDF